MTFQEVIMALQSYWAKHDCVIEQPYDIEVGAGTMHPATFLRVLGDDPWRVAYVQPSRRPVDGRRGENPNRLLKHYQLQVILKPPPANVQDLYLKSLHRIGIDFEKHDVRFLEDDWEAPTLGAAGLGWQVFLDGQEITQFTYFQQMGGIELSVVSAEITYGLERITMFLQRTSNVFDIDWAPGFSYREIRLREEVQQTDYAFKLADARMLRQTYDAFEKEAKALLDDNLVLPAYEYVLKCSHLFNLLDSRGSIGVAERTALIGRCRALAKRCAEVECSLLP